jgi:hypothetical protein
VGKDTAADVLVAKHGFVRRKFAQPIKEACSMLFQVSENHFEGPEKEEVVEKHGLSPRQMMQIVGTDMFRGMVDADFWLRHFKDWCARQPDDSRIVVTDLRFQNEIDAVKELGGLVVRITRSNGNGRHCLADKHVTEVGIAHLEGGDVHLENDSCVSSLWDKVENLVIQT